MTTCRKLMLVAAALLAAGLSGPAGAAEPPALAGRVLDTLGNGIPSVEVLVLDRGPASPTPVAAVLSDVEGYFRFSELLPGSYRIAALKDGYLTFVGAVDTAARRSVHLVLQPSAGLDGDRSRALPDDASWALRLPRRSILRETGPDAIDADSDPLESEPGQSEVSRLEVDQSIGASPAPSGSSSMSGVDSRDTRVRLALPLGERGSFAIQGSAGRHQATDADDAVANRDDRAMRVDVRYEPVDGAHLDVNAFYASRDFELTPGPGDTAVDGLRQQQGSVGYDASWTQRLDDRSEFAFGVDYTDVWLETPSASVGAGRGPAGVGSRVIGAQGGYRRRAGANHDVSMVLRARLLEWPQFGGIAEGPSGGRDRRPDLDVEFEAEDRWSIGAPWTVVYGLGHRQSLLDDGLRVTEPRVGATWDAAGWRVSAEVSYHDVDGMPRAPAVRSRSTMLDRHAATDEPAYRPRSDLGYEASVQVPVASGVSLEGRIRRAPVEFAHVRYDGPASGNPIYLSDGAAAVSERSVTLVQSSGRSSTSVELASGQAEGRLSAFVPFAEADDVAARGVAFDSARVGVRLPTSGTDLAFEYRRLSREPAQVRGEADPATLRTLEMRVRKSLWDVASSGDWRLLVALSVDSIDTEDLDRWRAADAHDDEALDALNRRISAGVSVAF